MTEAVFDVPPRPLYEPSRMDPALQVGPRAPGTVFAPPRRGWALRFTGLTMEFKGAADGRSRPSDDAESVSGREVARVGPVSGERAFITFVEPRAWARSSWSRPRP